VQTPLVLQITAQAVITRRQLLDRLQATEQLPEQLRRRLAVQLRDPELSTRALLQWGKALRAATAALGIGLVVNDRVDLALALSADGVHLGRLSVRVAQARRLVGPECWISVSCHGIGELGDAVEAGADAVLLSPIYPSPGKPAPLGVAALERAREQLGPGAATGLIALGGVSARGQLATACLRAGADGVAGIRADLFSVASQLAR
jgi:thiamine-phosphate pyrophosphorylase